MLPGLQKKSVVIAGYINQRTVELVNQEVEVDFLKSQELHVPHHEWKSWQENYAKAKSAVKELKKIITVLEKKYEEYLEEEKEEAEAIKKADKS